MHKRVPFVAGAVLISALVTSIAAAAPPETFTVPGAAPGFVSVLIVRTHVKTGHLDPPTFDFVKSLGKVSPTTAQVAGFAPVPGARGTYVGLAAVVNFNGLATGPAVGSARSGGAVLALRHAMNLALDRHALVIQRGAFSGKRTDQLLPPNLPGFKDGDLYPALAAGSRVPVAYRGRALMANVVKWLRGTPSATFVQAIIGRSAAGLSSPTGSGALKVTKVLCYANGTGGNAERDADLSLDGKAGWHFQQVFPASYVPGGSQSAPMFFLEDGPAPYNAPTTHIYDGFGVTVTGDVHTIASGQQVTVKSGLLDNKGNKLASSNLSFDFRCP